LRASSAAGQSEAGSAWATIRRSSPSCGPGVADAAGDPRIIGYLATMTRACDLAVRRARADPQPVVVLGDPSSRRSPEVDEQPRLGEPQLHQRQRL
jgi:hypothetical protein